jgi:hypothetical protein
MDLYTHSSIHLNGVVLNQVVTGTTLPLRIYNYVLIVYTYGFMYLHKSKRHDIFPQLAINQTIHAYETRSYEGEFGYGSWINRNC